jgi:hypothetical protein
MRPDTIFNVHLHSRKGTYGLYKLEKGYMFLQTRHYILKTHVSNFKCFENTVRNLSNVVKYKSTRDKLTYMLNPYRKGLERYEEIVHAFKTTKIVPLCVSNRKVREK